MFTASPASAVVPNGTYSTWDMPSLEHYNLDSRIFFGNHVDMSKNPAWFASSQYWPSNGSPGGYIGLQVDSNGRRAIWSWWGASGCSSSSVTGATCQYFYENGGGHQLVIPYNWTAGRTYKLRMWFLQNNANGTSTWGGWVSDESTGAEHHIGNMHVPQSFGWLDSSINWIEWYGGHRDTCADIPGIATYFHKLTGYVAQGTYEAAYYPPANHISSGQACNSRITNYGDPWVLHESPV